MKFLRYCSIDLFYTANVDFVRFEYVVLAKYQHLQILEFNLLIKQHILILCKNLLLLRCLMILNNPCYQVGVCTDHISTIQKCATVVKLFVAGICFCGWCGGGGSTVLSTLSSTNKQCMLSYQALHKGVVNGVMSLLQLVMIVACSW